MKKATLFRTLLLAMALGVILIMLSLPVYAEGDTTIILKKSTNKYLIYYSDICSNTFQFAISNANTTPEADLNFVSAAKDSTDEGALNVAFVDETNNPSNSDTVYIWIKDSTDTLVLSAEKIELENAIDDEFVKFINTTTIANKETDRIKVDTTQTQTKSFTEDGVDTTITTGKIVIDQHEGSKYYYKVFSANDTTSNAGKIYELADRINNYTGNSYGKLKLAIDFYELYLLQMPESSEWIYIENGEILQPEDTVDGDKLIVYIKEIKKDNREVIDIKLLECIRKEEQGKNQKTEEIKEQVKQTVRLPITYDSIALIVVFVVLLAAIIVFTVLKKRQNKNGK